MRHARLFQRMRDGDLRMVAERYLSSDPIGYFRRRRLVGFDPNPPRRLTNGIAVAYMEIICGCPIPIGMGNGIGGAGSNPPIPFQGGRSTRVL